MPQRRIHYTARAIIARQQSILVMQGKGEPFCHLPGGHIDPGEQPIDALIRELREEVGAEVGYLEWLAKIEDDWEGQPVHETMDLYTVHTWPLNAPLRALEGHLTAGWVQWWKIEDVGLRPRQVYPYVIRTTRSVA